jgi:hypothetical protein
MTESDLDDSEFENEDSKAKTRLSKRHKAKPLVDTPGGKQQGRPGDDDDKGTPGSGQGASGNAPSKQPKKNKGNVVCVDKGSAGNKRSTGVSRQRSNGEVSEPCNEMVSHL